VNVRDHRDARRNAQLEHGVALDDPLALVPAHQPDTVMRFNGGLAALAVTGHTHDGQVRLPFVGAVVNASKNPFGRGLHTWTTIPTFVTSWIGEVGLPIRPLNPPVIAVLMVR
jgi:predicted MPP superfamily phosphohydrolase